MCVCVCVCVCVCACACMRACVCVCTGLEIGDVASQNAYHFWGNCELLWQSDSQ